MAWLRAHGYSVNDAYHVAANPQSYPKLYNASMTDYATQTGVAAGRNMVTPSLIPAMNAIAVAKANPNLHYANATVTAPNGAVTTQQIPYTVTPAPSGVDNYINAIKKTAGLGDIRGEMITDDHRND
jgi:hypothetical protein